MSHKCFRQILEEVKQAKSIPHRHDKYVIELLLDRIKIIEMYAKDGLALPDKESNRENLTNENKE